MEFLSFFLGAGDGYAHLRSTGLASAFVCLFLIRKLIKLN